MTSVTVIGPGKMGSAIAAIAARGGASVQVVSRESDKAAKLAEQIDGEAAGFGDALTGDVVVLAVPYPAVADVVATYAEQLAGKIVVDLTNPVDFATFDGMAVAADGSAAAELAASLPSARVVKAFNTNFAATLATGQVGQAPTTVILAGDDADAKNVVRDVVEAGGLAVLDAGSLKRARELEAVGFLQLVLAVSEQVPWTGGIGVLR